jgi:arylformamidase
MSSNLKQLANLIGQCQAVDLSPVIRSNMVGWPEHPQVSVISDARNHQQHGYFCQTLLMPEHSGSHVDAPAHVHPHLMDRTIDTYRPDKLLGPGKKVSAVALGLRPGDALTLADFQRLAAEQDVLPEAGDVVLVEFGWDTYADSAEDYGVKDRNWWGGNEPGFAEDLCAWLAETGVRAVGTDTAACDAVVVNGQILSAPGHEKYFLPNDILIIEGLRGLDRLPGEFLFVALPLKLHQGSGSPLRAVALVG